METKPLLYGIIGFLMGGLLVSVAATTFDKPASSDESGMSMAQMTASLQDKRGDEFDKAFIAAMIEHHEGAVDMAKLASEKAGHEEIKRMSQDIITTQQAEISQMKQWRHAWGYDAGDDAHSEDTH